MTLDGQVIEGTSKPSSEIKMHIRAYKEDPEVMGVCHAHPPVCTSFAIAGIGLDRAIYPEALVNLGTVPCVHYEAPGSQGIPDSIGPYVKGYNGVLQMCIRDRVTDEVIPSHPTRVRGLKYNLKFIKNNCDTSHPTRVRGLKYICAKLSLIY